MYRVRIDQFKKTFADKYKLNLTHEIKTTQYHDTKKCKTTVETLIITVFSESIIFLWIPSNDYIIEGG